MSLIVESSLTLAFTSPGGTVISEMTVYKPILEANAAQSEEEVVVEKTDEMAQRAITPVEPTRRRIFTFSAGQKEASRLKGTNFFEVGQKGFMISDHIPSISLKVNHYWGSDSEGSDEDESFENLYAPQKLEDIL